MASAPTELMSDTSVWAPQDTIIPFCCPADITVPLPAMLNSRKKILRSNHFPPAPAPQAPRSLPEGLSASLTALLEGDYSSSHELINFMLCLLCD